MQDDVTVKGLCAAINKIYSRLFECIKKMDFYNNLHLLDEEDLDYLASINNIIWYKDSDPLNVKIEIIKNSEQVFWTLGTVFAVEQLITDIFGIGEVKEWFDYDGEPYHFKIVTENPQITAADMQEFSSIIDRVKKKSAILDSIEVALNATMNSYYGFKLHTGTFTILEQEG
jgi:P2-related tail formation protein